MVGESSVCLHIAQLRFVCHIDVNVMFTQYKAWLHRVSD
jgi:hypothetical protein